MAGQGWNHSTTNFRPIGAGEWFANLFSGVEDTNRSERRFKVIVAYSFVNSPVSVDFRVKPIFKNKNSIIKFLSNYFFSSEQIKTLKLEKTLTASDWLNNIKNCKGQNYGWKTRCIKI